jgi:hypothetical protein
VGATAYYGTVGGGSGNTVQPDAWYATIPGGQDNSAARYAFAAGSRAKANHTGAFVWADSTAGDFNSAAADEFAIRATGGLRLQSSRGIALNAANSPLITRGYDQFDETAPASKQTQGRWGVFMEPHTLVLGMPAIGGKTVKIGKYELNGTYTSLVNVDQIGNLYTAGSVNPPSDRAVKQDFASVNPRQVLEQVASMPIRSWAYTNNPSIRHIGPVAQDFHAAFAVGVDDKHIATVDADGVALAAIQGLNLKLEQQLRVRDAEVHALKQRLAELEETLRIVAGNLTDTGH